MFKIRFISMLVLLAVFSFSGAKAQEIVTIGEGTVTYSSNPIGTYYNYSITEQLYTAEEIGMAGTIESISFYYMGSAAKDLPITMYMKHVDAEDLESEGISLADADEVFSGTLSVTMTAGWVTITLDTPFVYDGESNLLIGVVKDYLYYFNGQTWQCTAMNSTMARYTQSDSAGPYGTSTVPGTAQTNRPNIQIGITPSTDCPKPNNFVVSNITAHTADLSWVSEATQFKLQYKKVSEESWTSKYPEEETTYTLTGLDPETTYQVRVQAHSESCGTDPETGDPIYSAFREITFTTDIACPAPTNLALTDGSITTSGATVTWEGTSDSYVVMIGEEDLTASADFETGNLSQAAFTTTTSYPFTVVENTHSGAYCAKSENSGVNGTTSDMVLEVTLSNDAILSFSAKVSSENGWDKAYFSIDDNVQSNLNGISGNGNWIDYSYPLTAGTHTLRWYYSKDGSGAGYDDSFYVDDIVVSTGVASWTEYPTGDQTYTFDNLTPDTDYQVKVKGNCGDDGYSQETAPVRFTTLPTCIKPTGVTVSNVTTHEATITWTSDGDAWQIMVNDDEENLIDVTETTYNFTGLAAETTFSVKVRTNCGGDDFSKWVRAGFTTEIACPVPTALLSDNISSTSTELSWTSDASQWDIAYKADGEEEFTEITGITQNPYSLEGLNPETTYTWKVRAYYPEEEDYTPYSAWTTTSSFTSYGLCPTPTNLHTTAVRSTSADLDWKGSIDVDYSVRYRVPQHMSGGISETFESTSMPEGWLKCAGKLNNDGTATLSNTTFGWSFGESKGVFDSHARLNIYGTGFYRWLITPVITMSGSTLSFDMALTAYGGSDVSAPDTNGTDDKFIVLISTDNMATWTILREWNNSGSEYVYNNIANSATGEQVSIDLSSYVGQEVRIAFYGESTASNADNYLHIDNVLIGQMVPATEWVTVGATETEATLTGLTPRTPYEVQVKSNCSEPEEWTEAIKFTTTIPELTLAVNDPAMGSVAIDGDELPAGVTDKGNGTYAVLPGTELTLKAQAADTYYLTAWVDADSTEITNGTNFADFLWNNSSLPTTATLNITMGTDDVTAQAIFATAGISLNVPAHEFVTYYADKTVTLPTMENGIQLYSVSSVSDTEVTLTSAIDVANTETPLLIYNSGNEAKDVLLITNVGTPANIAVANEFQGTLSDTTFTADVVAAKSFYVCNGKQFVPVRTAGTIAANRCWLEIGSIAAARALNIVFGDEATGIESIDHEPLTIDHWYDLNGRKVQSLKKGIYVNNGRKVVIK